jgi:hypothetical protein
MSPSGGVPTGFRTHHFREYESRTQSVWLQSYNASGHRLFWPRNSWLCCHSPSKWRNRHKISPQQLPYAWCQILDSLIMLPFGAIHSDSFGKTRQRIKSNEWMRVHRGRLTRVQEPRVQTGQENGWSSWPYFEVWEIEYSITSQELNQFFFISAQCLETLMLGKWRISCQETYL